MQCRVCDSVRLEPVLELGRQPWCNHFLRPDEVGREPFYPLSLLYCTDCATTQLDYTVAKEVMFSDHTYLSGITKSLDEHFAGVANDVTSRFLAAASTKSVLDIGSNDGTQLKHFQRLGYDVLGVESSKTTAEMAIASGVPTLKAFFNQETARQIGRQFDIINAAGVFFHLEELHSVTDGIREALKPDGVFVVQFLYMKRIVENLAFDQIYHEHLLYYNLRPLSTLLKRHGLEMFDAYVSPIHGGSVIAFCGHAGHRQPSERLQSLEHAEDVAGANTKDYYRKFARRVEGFRTENLRALADRRSSGKRIWGMGAPVKGNTLINYLGVSTETIECLVERNALRRGRFAPGSHIPVKIEDELVGRPDVYYVLAWNFKREILKRYSTLIDEGVEFLFPIDPDRAS